MHYVTTPQDQHLNDQRFKKTESQSYEQLFHNHRHRHQQQGEGHFALGLCLRVLVSSQYCAARA